MGWEIWGLPWISYPRVTRLFDLHSDELVSNSTPGWFTEQDWLKEANPQRNVLCYCDPSRLHLYPNSVAFPLAEVNKSIPIPYYENTIAYQLALAIHEGAEEIGLWGVHMMGRQEFTLERPSVTYLIGLAQGKGIKVTVAPGSPLFMSAYTQGRYGVSMDMRDFPTANAGITCNQ